jgi:hypothetical protein
VTLSFVTTIFLIVGIPITITAALNPAFKAKMTTKEELAKTIKFVEYMKEHHPEKIGASSGS